MSDDIDIKGLDHAAVLAALYNAARAQGLGMLRFKPEPMTISQARDELKAAGKRGQPYFDYLHGRVMKVQIHGDSLNPRCYDRDNGQYAAAEAINSIRVKQAA